MKRVSIRFPDKIHERMAAHREATSVTTNGFVVRAVEQALNDHDTKSPRPKGRRLARQAS